MSIMKGDSEHSEYVHEVKPARRQGRFKRHCARFWWLHLLVFIAISLVVILPV